MQVAVMNDCCTSSYMFESCMCGSLYYTIGGSRGEREPLPLEKSPKYRVSWQKNNIGSMKSTATKPAFNVGPSSARQRNAWRADDGPLIMVFGPSLPSSTKKTHKKNAKCIWTPSDKIFWVRASLETHVNFI